MIAGLGGEASSMASSIPDFSAAVPILKSLAAEVRKTKRLAGPNVRTTTVVSRLCGSQLTLDAEFHEGRVRAIGYQVRACSLGQASTALVAKRAIDLDLDEIKQIKACLQSLLQGARLDAAEIPWPELAIFTHAANLPARHGAALLPFQALEQLMEDHSQADG